MNYSEHFRDKDPGELKELLSNRSLLNFEAQRCLVSEINKRSLEVDENQLQELKQLIAKEESKIQDFQYLPFLGFSIKNETDTVIRRLGSARRVDLFSVLFSIIMMLAAIPLTDLVANFMEEGLTGAFPVLALIVCVAVVAYGIMLFLRSWERILDLWRFEILKRGDSLQIRKGKETYVVGEDRASSQQVKSRDGRTNLVLAQDQNSDPVTLMSTDGGLRLHLTLKHLRDHLVN